jgi:hypothetical protein
MGELFWQKFLIKGSLQKSFSGKSQKNGHPIHLKESPGAPIFNGFILTV